MPDIADLAEASELTALSGSRFAAPAGVEALLEYNGLVMNNRSTIDKIRVTEIGGFGDADIRQSSEPLPEDDGEEEYISLYGGRTVTLRGRVESYELPKMRDMFQALKMAFMEIDQQLPLLIRHKYRWINLITNPSFETDLDGWSGSGSAALTAGATVTRVSDANGVGDFSAQVVTAATSNQGIVFTGLTLEAGKTYRIRLKVRRGAGGAPLQVIMRDSTAGTNNIIKADFNPGTSYQDESVTFTATNSGTHHLAVRTNAATVTTFHVDAFLVADQANGVPEYSDGDQGGGQWTGDPHASTSEIGKLGTDAYINCKKSASFDGSEQQVNQQHYRDFLVTLRAKNPRFLSRQEESKKVDLNASDTIPVVNRGSWKAQPIIKFYGPMPAQVLQNTLSGRIVRTKSAIPDGHVWTYDTAKRTFKDQLGANKFNELHISSNRIFIDPEHKGDTTFETDASTGLGASSAIEIIHRHTWM